MSVSIRELAEKAGVSVTTVSHVLNRTGSARVALGTQERVWRTAEEMGYKPNPLARSLGRRKTDMVGLLISGLQNPFFVSVMERAEEIAAASGYGVQLDCAPSVNGTYKDHYRLFRWPVDGAIVWALSEQDVAAYLGAQNNDIPLVYLGGKRDDKSDWVSFDYEGGGRLVTEHLIGRGRKRIAYVSPYPFGEGRSDDPRHVAYTYVCRQHGMAPRMLLTDAKETRQAGLQIAAKIATMPQEMRPDALFCHNDMIAIGAYIGFIRAGIRVPEEIAVVGFDGIEDTAFLEKRLTTVRLSPEELCRHAFVFLEHRLSGGKALPPQSLILPTQLIVGETT